MYNINGSQDWDQYIAVKKYNVEHQNGIPSTISKDLINGRER